MEQADLIWMNGEFVTWEDAKVHVLTHGLHYGTGVFEGVRATTPRAARRSSATPSTSTGCSVGRAVLHGDAVHARGAPRSDARADRAQRLAQLLHPPARLPRLRAMGLFPLDAPVEWRSRSGSGGPTSARRASATASAPRSPPGGASRRLADPARQGLGPVPELDPGQDRAHKAGYEEAILLDDDGYVCEGSGENIFVVRDGAIVTPPQTAGILDGINRRSVIQIARDLGFKVIERDIARAELYLADECSSRAPPPSSCRCARSTTTRSARATGRDHPRDPGRLRGRAARAPERYLEWLDPVPRSRAARRRPLLQTRGRMPPRRTRLTADIQLYDTTLRDGMQGEGMSLSVDEKLRVAHTLDELGIHFIEAGFPRSNPKELELFELLGRRSASSTPRSPPSA